MKLTEIVNSFDVAQPSHMSLVKRRYNGLSRIPSFELESFGPAGPDDRNVVKRRSNTSGKALRKASTNCHQGQWLVKLGAYAAATTNEPVNVLELGTCVGISAMYLMCGIASNKGGHLTTLEGSPELAELATEYLDSFLMESGIENVTYEILVGSIDTTLYEWVDSMNQKLHLAFVDGNHQKEPTISYHNALGPLMSEKGIIVHDDISWGEDMKKAWQTIQDIESDSAQIEFYLGGKPSRGVIFRGEAPLSNSEIINSDSFIERIARKSKAMLVSA